MNRNHFHRLMSVVILFLSMLACGLPAQNVPPTANVDPNAIETAIVGTLEASAKQTQQAGLATSAAYTGSTSTATPVTSTSSSGTSLVYLADGSTQFIDHTAGMQTAFPPGWLLVRVGEQEYYAAWEKEETKNPLFLDIFASMQNLDPKVFRVTALDIRPDHMSNENILQIEVVFNEGDTRTLKQVKSDETKSHPPLVGYKLLSSQFFQTSQGMQALNMEIQWKYTNDADASTRGYRRRVIFEVPSGIMALDLLTTLDKKDLVMPEYDQVLNNVTLTTP